MAQLETQTRWTRQRCSATHTGHRTGGRSLPTSPLVVRFPYSCHHQVPSPDRYSSRNFFNCTFRLYPAQRASVEILRSQIVSGSKGRYPRELRRDASEQRRICEEPPLSGLRLDAEHGAQEKRHRPGRPGLGPAGGRVGDRRRAFFPGISGEYLRKPVVEVWGGVEDGEGDEAGLRAKTVAGEPVGYERVVVWPDAAGMVALRVVAALALGHRPDAEAAHQALAEEVIRDSARLALGHDTAQEEVPDVGGQRIHRATFSIECQGVVAAGFDPEIPVEAFFEAGGLLAQLAGEPGVVPRGLGQLGGPRVGVVGVPLDLAERDPTFGLLTVAEVDAIAGVLPAVVLQPSLGAGFVVYVAVRIGVLQEPAQSATSRGLELPREVIVGGPAPHLVEKNEEERGSIDGAVVGGVRDLAKRRQLAATEFVENLPGLCVSEVVPPGRLVTCQRSQDVPRRLLVQEHGLKGGDKPVPPEECHVPRGARRRHEEALLDLEGERSEVLDTPVPAPE